MEYGNHTYGKQKYGMRNMEIIWNHKQYGNYFEAGYVEAKYLGFA